MTARGVLLALGWWVATVAAFAAEINSGARSPQAPLIAAATPPEARRSGFEFMSPETQAMQRDDTLNPGMLWVADGEALWKQKAGAADKACASCHGDAATSMRGVATRYPRFDQGSGRAVDLGQRINLCRQQRQQAPRLAPEGAGLLSLEAYVALQSRGLPLAPDADPRLAPERELGRQLFNQRLGQLNLSCAQCHDERWGRRLGSAPIPQAHATGYPIYRLEWQGMGSLQRRLRNCMAGVRAEPFAPGAPEWVALELYLAERSKGMALETPAVRP
jgi:sulfur-oxidizing protein SoxA